MFYLLPVRFHLRRQPRQLGGRLQEPRYVALPPADRLEYLVADGTAFVIGLVHLADLGQRIEEHLLYALKEFFGLLPLARLDLIAAVGPFVL